MSFFADALQHSELIFAIVNVAAAGLHERRSDLAGDMKQRRSTIPRFDDRAGGVSRARARARERDAEFAGHARIRIGHVHDSAFVPGRDHAKSAVPLNRVVKRNVVNADDAEYRIDADPLQFV